MNHLAISRCWSRRAQVQSMQAQAFGQVPSTPQLSLRTLIAACQNGIQMLRVHCQHSASCQFHCCRPPCAGAFGQNWPGRGRASSKLCKLSVAFPPDTRITAAQPVRQHGRTSSSLATSPGKPAVSIEEHGNKSPKVSLQRAACSRRPSDTCEGSRRQH